MASPTNRATALLAGISQKPPLFQPSGLAGPVATMSTMVTATAQASDWRTRARVAIVTKAMAGSSSAAPFS